MATSSQDQPDALDTIQRPAHRSKPGFWLRFLVLFVACLLAAILILVLLSLAKILPSQWFLPLSTIFSPLLAAIITFVRTTLVEQDFQQALRKWLTTRLFGNTEGQRDAKDASTLPTAPSPNITITITNTNTATNTSPDLPTQAFAQPRQVNALPLQDTHITPTTPNPPLFDPIFFVSVNLTDPAEFYGRTRERTQLLSRTRATGCTSIVGPHRSGKTWLMTYLLLVAAEQLGANFRVGSMSAALPSVATIAGFTREALTALAYPTLSLPKRPDLTMLQHVVRNIVAQKQVPVLCIDEFEGLTQHAEFDRQFFEGLRAITGLGLVLVAFSKEPLIDLVSETTKTSPFFNIFLQLPLLPFNPVDAQQFIQQKGDQAQFTTQERAHWLAYARTGPDQFPPLRLQLVGERLFHDKRAASTLGQHHSFPAGLEYWQTFQQDVETAYKSMVKS